MICRLLWVKPLDLVVCNLPTIAEINTTWHYCILQFSIQRNYTMLKDKIVSINGRLLLVSKMPINSSRLQPGLMWDLG